MPTERKDERNDDSVAVKLFVGFQVTSEMRMHLHRSKAWQQASVLCPSERDLIEIHHHGHDYVGRFLPQDRLILSDVRANDALAKKALKEYCPECDLDGITVRIFPQVFVS